MPPGPPYKESPLKQQCSAPPTFQPSATYEITLMCEKAIPLKRFKLPVVHTTIIDLPTMFCHLINRHMILRRSAISLQVAGEFTFMQFMCRVKLHPCVLLAEQSMYSIYFENQRRSNTPYILFLHSYNKIKETVNPVL